MDSVREVQGITFTDDLAWMEEMKGPRWEKLIKEEQENWSKAVPHGLSRLKSQIKTATEIGKQKRFVSGPIIIGHVGTMAYQWRWKDDDSHKVHEAADICTLGDTVFVSYEDSTIAGAENYVVAAFRKNRTLWRRGGMSPYVGVIGDRCYSIKVKNKLVYYKCVSWNLDGSDYRTEYEEKDPRYNLELIRGTDVLFLRRQSGPKQDVMQITATGSKLLEPICLESSRFVLGSRAGEYLHWLKGKWVSKGIGLVLPSFEAAVPEVLDTERSLLITRWQGKRTLWALGKKPQIVWTGIGNILIDPWQGPWIRIIQPGVPIAWMKIDQPRVPHPVAQEHYARSKDGTHIPFYTVFTGHGKPRGLFVAAYSAYGIGSSFSTARWRPLLAEGWAIAFGIYRGGGDHTPEWEDAGRLTGRLNVLEDAEVVVRLARSLYDMPASSTVIYGRSAGGLWVGGLCSKYPNGDLFGGAYMEVPYLDVLRTTTNHSLPLTFLETDEFGLPAMRVSDLAGMLKWSPMETLTGTPGIFQVVRTGLNDSQVFAYESVKWVTRSRKRNAGRIFLAIEGGQGHFVNGDKGLQQQAEDISVILSLVNGKKSHQSI
jgi:protease II